MKIQCLKNLYNKGKCFSKGKKYEAPDRNNEAGLMEAKVINDLGEKHIIGKWWRHFKIVK